MVQMYSAAEGCRIVICKGEVTMKKPAYFIIQFLWAFVLAAIIWFGFMNTVSVDGNNRTAAIIFIGGAVLYLILTAAYIVLGWKKVEDYRIGMTIVSVAINIVTVVIGFFVATGLSYVLFHAGG